VHTSPYEGAIAKAEGFCSALQSDKCTSLFLKIPTELSESSSNFVSRAYGGLVCH
jgi:hypothetical protein